MILPGRSSMCCRDMMKATPVCSSLRDRKSVNIHSASLSRWEGDIQRVRSCGSSRMIKSKSRPTIVPPTPIASIVGDLRTLVRFEIVKAPLVHDSPERFGGTKLPPMPSVSATKASLCSRFCRT